jgi:hypothetical protein
MPYTLIMPSGKRMQFYLLSVAELYQKLNGGYILEQDGKPALRLVA